jgi:guanine nucleotide-binding protein G(i) subunit alpha
MDEFFRTILKLNHLDVKLAPLNETHRATVLCVPDTLKSDVIPPEITNAMRKLCRDRGIQNVLQDQQSINVVGESYCYYLRCIERITHEGYIPSYQDVLHRYFKPGGIAEVNLKDGGLTYRIIHIGRQDGAWRKWIHCFEGMEAIAFLVRLDEYDQFFMIDGERSVVSPSLINLFQPFVMSKSPCSFV